MTETGAREESGIRLDKWLWAARFFKTRQLAVEAVNGGRVQVNGQRAKPGKWVSPGSRLSIHKGSLAWEIEIKGVSRQRRSAPEAARLYEETEESRLRRQDLVRQRREVASHPPSTAGRPSKRDRRMIHWFTRGSDL